MTTPEKDVRIRRIMDEGKVLLVNLAKGRIGEDSSALLGGLLVRAIGLAAYSRADMPETQRRNFFVYVDEFQSFTTLALANMLSSCASTGSASRSRTSTCISWNPTYGTPYYAMSALSYHSASARRTRHTSSANSMKNLRWRISCSSRTTGFISSS